MLGIVLLAVGYLIGNTFPVSGTVLPSAQAQLQAGQQQQAPTTGIKLDIPSYLPAKGADSAKINIVEFGDYQCPFCERFFSQTESQLISSYVTSGKAKFYFADFAFLGPDSTTLSEGAWCANEQGKYYAYHDFIYSNQQQENTGWASADKVKALIANSSTGIDSTAFGSCLDSKKYESRVSDLTKLGQKSGVSGTPSFLIGNADKGYTLLVGAQPYTAFQQAIDPMLQ